MDSRKVRDDMRQTPRPFEIYRHFKGKLYQIMTIAKDSETGEDMVVYQQLYAPYGAYVRPLDMFMSEVDREKYPQVEQKYRFEKVQEAAFTQVGTDITASNAEQAEQAEQAGLVSEVKSASISNSPIKEDAVSEVYVKQQEESLEEEFELAPGLMEFLDADSYEEKLDILSRLHASVTDAMIDTMAVSLDMEIKEGDIEQRYNELKSCLLKMEHFECNRLR